VVTWGDASYGGDSSAVATQLDGTIDVTQVFSTEWAFAALRADGSVVTWGMLRVAATAAPWPKLDGTIDVTQVFSTLTAFAALRADGSVVTWGMPAMAATAAPWRRKLDGTIDVTQVFSTALGLCRAARRWLGGDLGVCRTMAATAAPWRASCTMW
jgi:hypothetical protein